AVYGLLPRLTGREPNPLAVGVHFWLALVGVLTYVISISVAGVLQGFAWVSGQSFIASVIAAGPMWLWRTIGGLLMVGSHIVFAFNVWAMRPHRVIAPAPSPDVVRTPRELRWAAHGPSRHRRGGRHRVLRVNPRDS